MPANPILVTMSTAGVSRAANIDWTGNTAVTVGLSASASNSASDFTLQYTLSDLQQSSSPAWFGYSSAIGSTSQHFSAATIFDNGVSISFLTPIAGLRLSSTTLSSAAQTLSLRILQGTGGY